MRELPPGWATDLAVLELTGSTVQEHGDHLLVRTEHNPGFHWGNCLFVTDEDAVAEAGRWVETFQLAFPKASWIAIGLIRMPDDQDAWVAQGLTVELDDVLTTATCPDRLRFPTDIQCVALREETGSNPWRGRWPRTTEPARKTPCPMRDSLAGGCRRGGRSASGRWRPFSGRSRTMYSSPSWASSSAVVGRRATRASAPTRSTGVGDWPLTSSGLPPGGPATVAVTGG